MAAFAIGLDRRRLGAPSRCVTALADPDPLVQGRAAEGAGSDRAQAGRGRDRRDDAGARQGRRARRASQPTISSIPKPPPVEAVRLGMYALVRLGAYDPLAVGAARRQRRARSAAGGRSPMRSDASPIRAAGTALLTLLEGDGRLHARVCRARTGRASRSRRAGRTAGRAGRQRCGGRATSGSRRCDRWRTSARPTAVAR